MKIYTISIVYDNACDYQAAALSANECMAKINAYYVDMKADMADEDQLEPLTDWADIDAWVSRNFEDICIFSFVHDIPETVASTTPVQGD